MLNREGHWFLLCLDRFRGLLRRHFDKWRTSLGERIVRWRRFELSASEFTLVLTDPINRICLESQVMIFGRLSQDIDEMVEIVINIIPKSI